MYEQAQHVAFRQTFPLARMMAHIGNVNGGISRKKPKSKVNDSIPYDWEDFLPPFAQYKPLLDIYKGGDPLTAVDPDAIKELWAARDFLPRVLYMAVDWDDIKKRAEA